MAVLLRRPQVLDRDSPLRVAAPFEVQRELERQRGRPLPWLGPEQALRELARQELRRRGLPTLVAGGDQVTAETCPRVDIAAGSQVTGTTEGAISTSPTYAGSGSGTGGSGGFWYPLRSIELVARGVATTGGTPGTLTINWRLDSTSGASLGASASLTLLASQTNVTWEFRGDIVCRSVGTSGTLWGQGYFMANAALIATNLNLVPASGPATTTIDTTVAHSFVLTALLSQAGSSLTTQQAFWRIRN